MNRILLMVNITALSVPRASGDEPYLRLARPASQVCSPRERG